MSTEATRQAEEAKWLVDEAIDDFYRGTLREHQLLAAIDKLASMIPAGGLAEEARWQPIETAPRNGTWLLVAGPDHTGARRMVCRWLVGLEWESADDGYGAYIQPTHWMPLPDVPAAMSAPTPQQEQPR